MYQQCKKCRQKFLFLMCWDLCAKCFPEEFISVICKSKEETEQIPYQFLPIISQYIKQDYRFIELTSHAQARIFEEDGKAATTQKCREYYAEFAKHLFARSQIFQFLQECPLKGIHIVQEVIKFTNVLIKTWGPIIDSIPLLITNNNVAIAARELEILTIQHQKFLNNPPPGIEKVNLTVMKVNPPEYQPTMNIQSQALHFSHGASAAAALPPSIERSALIQSSPPNIGLRKCCNICSKPEHDHPIGRFVMVPVNCGHNHYLHGECLIQYLRQLDKLPGLRWNPMEHRKCPICDKERMEGMTPGGFPSQAYQQPEGGCDW